MVIGSYVELRYFSLQPLCLWVNHLEILLYRCLIYQSCCLRKQKVQKLPTYHFFSILFTKNSFHPVKGMSVCCIKWGLYIDEALFGGNWGCRRREMGRCSWFTTKANCCILVTLFLQGDILLLQKSLLFDTGALAVIAVYQQLSSSQKVFCCWNRFKHFLQTLQRVGGLEICAKG